MRRCGWCGSGFRWLMVERRPRQDADIWASHPFRTRREMDAAHRASTMSESLLSQWTQAIPMTTVCGLLGMGWFEILAKPASSYIACSSAKV
jgi:hypothetical protein